MRRLDLQAVVAALEERHANETALSEPLAILVNETVGYLIDDERRAALFEEFEKRVGLDTRRILDADPAVVLDITRRGGMAPEKRAERLKEIARIIASDCGGDLDATLRRLPLPKARTLLKRFPSVGAPGADRILLFGGYAAVPAVESNGLRGLVRMGFVTERPNWSQTYRDAVRLIAEEGLAEASWLKSAWLGLRGHGKALCKRATPICGPCPFDAKCAHAETTTL